MMKRLRLTIVHLPIIQLPITFLRLACAPSVLLRLTCLPIALLLLSFAPARSQSHHFRVLVVASGVKDQAAMVTAAGPFLEDVG